MAHQDDQPPAGGNGPLQVTLAVTAGPHKGRVFTFGGHDTFPLLDGKEATICIKSGVGKDKKASLTVKATGRDEMMCSVICGKCLPLKTTHVTKDEGRLFLAILIRPCNKGE